MNIFWINGRYGRFGYFCTVLMCNIAMYFADFLSKGKTHEPIGYFLGIVILLCLWLIICAAAKRCHDLGHNGFWQLIPFYGLWLLFKEGDSADNEYGSAD